MEQAGTPARRHRNSTSSMTSSATDEIGSEDYDAGRSGSGGRLGGGSEEWDGAVARSPQKGKGIRGACARSRVRVRGKKWRAHARQEVEGVGRHRNVDFLRRAGRREGVVGKALAIHVLDQTEKFGCLESILL